MVKTKQQKSTKPKRNPHVKKQGKQADITQFRAQLDALGLKIIQVTADVCRALADQLEGSEEEHGKYRAMVVQYLMKNRDTFEPFIEDDIPFDEYCQSMEKDGTWAGHMELQAASLVTRSNICIHQYMSPRWYIRNFDERGACMVHLSYHDEEHYNSVRLKEDTCIGPARPIIIKADADLSATTCQAKTAASKSKGGAAKNSIDPSSIKVVIAGSGCQDAQKVEQVLLQVDGDVDAAIEFLRAEREADDSSPENHSFQCHADSCYGDCKAGNCEQHGKEPLKDTHSHDPSNGRTKPTNGNSSCQAGDKKIARNKTCPCGSKKKYKACCGAVKAKPSAKFLINQTVDSRKVKKERKQRGKGPAESDGSPPDVGALCI
ncbi:OVARIAN TUMOR DOMAIN-containing deubiquitinating enzyme 7 isoform X3 [Ricinus communis]|uniref:OVARIAN TUMOR DOMAIN-containing deubiquitinating enzyme 7 isoform X3 n=1 Tax=Ricinus communis TaxID=3988 RepID=UPI00201B3421|nr:OVARIAN TUMOR DOMAIN-containing deubiquitinating enzyme 7 isoform X3 [Ricinus communis]